jgi:DNA-binding NtrC family response regulator
VRGILPPPAGNLVGQLDAEESVVFNSGRYSFCRAVRSQSQPMTPAVILIIEDDVHIAGLVAEVLREAGHAPALVRDVRAARDWSGTGNRPAAVLSDLMVAGSAGPDRLPGELEAIFPGTPVALMTGVPRNRRAALGVTHARILEKPFELETLVDLVSAMLAPRAGEGA